MLLQSTNGEVFEVLPHSAGSPEYDELPDTRSILVRQFKEARAKDGSLFFEIEIRQFIKGALKFYAIDSVHPITIFPKEDIMSNSMNLIEAANKAGQDGIKVAFADLNRKLLERAIRVAESQNEFQAQATLSEFLESLGLGKSKASTIVAPTDGQSVQVTKDANVTDRLWAMILGKVDKLGSVTAVKGNTASLILKKGKDTEAFLKSVATIKGIKIA